MGGGCVADKSCSLGAGRVTGGTQPNSAGPKGVKSWVTRRGHSKDMLELSHSFHMHAHMGSRCLLRACGCRVSTCSWCAAWRTRRLLRRQGLQGRWSSTCMCAVRHDVGTLSTASVRPCRRFTRRPV